MDLTVVFQGRAEEVDIDSVRLLKKVFPKSQIILSSWLGSVNNKLYDIFDYVVENEDPGSDYPDIINVNVADNFRRQRFSTLNGLLKAENKWTLKLRSDVKVSERIYNITKLPFLLSSQEKKYCVSTAGSINPKKFPILLHFSDLIQFGKTSDLIKLWEDADTRLKKESKWKIITRKMFFSLSGMRAAKTACEQRLWLGGNSYSNSFHFDSIKSKFIQLHNLHLKRICFFETNYFGIVLPDRVYQGSKSAQYFYSTDEAKAIKMKALIFIKIKPNFYIRYMKSWLLVVLIILDFNKRVK